MQYRVVYGENRQFSSPWYDTREEAEEEAEDIQDCADYATVIEVKE